MNNRDIYRFRNRLLAEESQGAMCNECGGPMYEGMCMECGYMEEELKGDQHKIDADKDGEITAKDFKMLRAKNEGHEGQDHEVSMANNSLDAILWAANELKKYLGDQERDIPAWIQDHITNAENYIIQAAKNFHEYGSEEATEGEPIPDEMSLQEMVKKVGNKYNVYSKKGKKLGSHPSKKKAQKQMAAIEISKQGK